MVDNLRSTGEISSPSLNWRWTCSEYHSLNFLRMNSLTDLLMLKSIGCKRSVQLAGTHTTRTLFSSKSFSTLCLLALENIENS